MSKLLIPSSTLEPKYLTFAIQGNSAQLLGLVTSAGNTAGVLDTRIVQAFEILVPSKHEQRVIVDSLNDVDSLIASLERLIAKKQAIKRGIMEQLLTGATRLPGFGGEWRDVSLGEVSRVTMGQSPSSSAYNTKRNGLPLIQGNADIHDRETFDRIWTTQVTKRCEKGDVVLTVRAPVGFTAVALKDSCIGRGVCSLSSARSNRFLFHALVFGGTEMVCLGARQHVYVCELDPGAGFSDCVACRYR